MLGFRKMGLPEKLSPLITIFLFFNFLSTPSLAQPETASTWTVDQLMQSLAQVKESNATFVERKHLSILKTPIEYSGTLAYRAPGRLEKKTLLPKPESMILDQDKLIVQMSNSRRKHTLSLQDYPVVWAFVESFRATLAGDQQTLNRFYSASLEGPSGQWLLTLHPTDAKMKDLISKIRITGSREKIHSIETREKGGDYSVMTITPMTINPAAINPNNP